MWKYILKRFAYMLLTLLVVTTITFFLVHAIPGDPLTAMVEDMPEETRAVYMAKWGFDQPIVVQYGKYMLQLLHFDLGASSDARGAGGVDCRTQGAPLRVLCASGAAGGREKNCECRIEKDR